jgi:hypothetical protein
VQIAREKLEPDVKGTYITTLIMVKVVMMVMMMVMLLMYDGVDNNDYDVDNNDV